MQTEEPRRINMAGQLASDKVEAVREVPEQMQFDLGNLAVANTNGASTLKEERKKFKEMLEDILKNNQPYQELSAKATEATKEKTKQKNEVLKQPHAKELNDKIKELNAEIKEKNAAASDYAVEFAKQFKDVNEIEGKDGKTYYIQLEGRLVEKPE